MNSLQSILLLLSSALIGSSFSSFISELISPKLAPYIISQPLPENIVSTAVTQSKVTDVTDFILTGVLTAILFGVNYAILSKLSNHFKFQPTGILVFLVSAITIFIQVHFMTFSKLNLVFFLMLSEILLLMVSHFKLEFNQIREKPSLIFIAIFLGFYLSLIANLVLPIGVFNLILPLLVLLGLLIKPQQGTQVASVLALLAIFFPTDLVKLLVLGVGIVIISIILVIKPMNQVIQNILEHNIYPIGVIILLTFNPLFFIGNFDSVEEGFWLSWLQHLQAGQVLYKDVWAYQPPLIPWGMYLFGQVAGLTLYSERLFLHILQIIAIIIFFIFSRQLISNRWLLLTNMALFLSLSQSLVRNNVEFRVGVGLLALILLFKFLKNDRNAWLISSGVAAGIALFTSVEAGVSVIVAVPLTLALGHKLKRIPLFFLGVCLPIILIGGYLGATNSLIPFLQQVTYYTGVFSAGYFNIPIERSISLSFFHWHIFDQYLGSNAMYWEVAKLSLIIGGLYLITQRITKKRLTVFQVMSLAVVLFGIILTRSALGRSDWYHLLFILPIAITLIFAAISKLALKPVWISILVISCLMVIARTAFSNGLLEDKIQQFQTYGQIEKSYQSYAFDRGQGIISDEIDQVNQTSLIVNYIQNHVTENQSIFTFPWSPDFYFLTNRNNATKNDTPYAFFTDMYQQQTIDQLQANPPKIVVYDATRNLSGLTPQTLEKLNDYLKTHYTPTQTFGSYQIMELSANINK